jgi:hypothetical protein
MVVILTVCRTVVVNSAYYWTVTRAQEFHVRLCDWPGAFDCNPWPPDAALCVITGWTGIASNSRVVNSPVPSDLPAK